ncbi:hypothetical protein CGLO_11303 [Colletotrichum gloeosporioides Cg-14]|uniref:Uncharacterized protein n=1 Tax=Colletotrichum gloeosporioides (strain Cg-14) TaxID=1237896 RepID=T0LC72_COLGC|nr:hypothetical protein CGLO_11303 [Colletotrichum gloeosporioides Cg-14]
MKYKQIKYLR